ncbi:phage holin [Virgibacillus sediminis]|uniref:Phage holin n=1 Tax=Virgibacillus sediminis TaxID=202260 RepID=A0ABV7A6R6_9BACI
MKINWKTRVRSYPFWMAVFGLVGLIVTRYMGFDSGEFQDIADAVMYVLITAGIVADPNTEGFKDSELSLGYTKPKKEVK